MAVLRRADETSKLDQVSEAATLQVQQSARFQVTLERDSSQQRGAMGWNEANRTGLNSLMVAQPLHNQLMTPWLVATAIWCD